MNIGKDLPVLAHCIVQPGANLGPRPPGHTGPPLCEASLSPPSQMTSAHQCQADRATPPDLSPVDRRPPHAASSPTPPMDSLHPYPLCDFIKKQRQAPMHTTPYRVFTLQVSLLSSYLCIYVVGVYWNPRVHYYPLYITLILSWWKSICSAMLIG
jgi:hypothetical protein